ncbi:DUF2239 family protein [Hydrogenophaga defluvii]|uniref:DUF2239 family protein n=1 Tax=Hydrogenophaga defluvii TaxID=249410 RepID=A0ABW2SGA6_9BURK
MTLPEHPSDPPTCTAFLGDRRVAAGTYAEVTRLLDAMPASNEGLLVFDDSTGAVLDRPLPVVSDPAPTVGRPRLGVVAREVTLLPRHWEWLAQQQGGASAALRRLVDEARRQHADADAQRLARERAYRCMSALAADLPGFEEASRALFAGDASAFEQYTAHWPQDVRQHIGRLASGGFDAAQPAT